MSVENDVSVEVYQSKEELILYLSRKMNLVYAEAKEHYEQQATVIA